MIAPAIGVLVHPGEEAVVETVRRHGARHDWQVWSASRDVADAVAAHASVTRLLVTVGGDGTFLLGARLAAPIGIPVMGVNRGRLGFLTSVEVSQLGAAIEAFIADTCTAETRTLLRAVSRSGGFDEIALNDVVFKSPGVAVARLRVDVDGALLGEFDADGVVIATATGSTAYALSAGGPPVDPRVAAVVVVPLAPHAVMTRAVVLPDSVDLQVSVERGTVVAAADGLAERTLGEGVVVDVQMGPRLTVIQPPGAPGFTRRLHEKLRFGTPLKAREHPVVDEKGRVTGDGTA